MTTPARWLVLTAEVHSRDLRDLAAEALIDFGGSSVVEEGHNLSTYLRADGDPDQVCAQAVAAIAHALPSGSEFEVGWSWREDQDWASEWKRGLRPRQVSRRIVVKPTWTEWAAEPGQIVLDIDPQMAFGTGEHATTRGCLRILDEVVRDGDRALDVGSGSAILAIAAALLGAREIVAVEYDPDANINARENIASHQVEDRITLIERMADGEFVTSLGPFDLIIANILSGVIRPLLPSFSAAIPASGGRLILSGILQSEHDEVVADAAASSLVLESEDHEDEWWSGLFVRSAAR